MGLLEVTKEFEKIGYQDKIILLKEKTATVLEAAEALHVEPDMIAKTLTFKTENSCLLVVVAGTRKVDNAKFKKTFERKARMLSPDEALEFTGHAVGGICPFGLKNNLPVYLDISLKEHNIVYPACGNAHSAIALSISELEKLSHMTKWVDITKEK